MKIKVRKIGNAEGVVIPKTLLKKLRWKAGDQLELSATDDVIRLRAVDPDFERQLEAARYAMEKYKVALSRLADS
ncbi:AbrB/MazE/SpoVT family DNA-binding domain-containing protein [Pararhizobium sp. A13]|uniref:AbrB/MazE/SpoVT family DNA-binding domain-containing protein n=1 Tax=Pararhizobium sp. A13 TaxID=3133975 RepID=UPI00324C9D19